MGLIGQTFKFNPDEIAKAAESPGVFELYVMEETRPIPTSPDHSNCIFIGHARRSLKESLLSHLDGAAPGCKEPGCTKKATHFRRRECDDSEQVAKALIGEFLMQSSSRELPECNPEGSDEWDPLPRKR